MSPKCGIMASVLTETSRFIPRAHDRNLEVHSPCAFASVYALGCAHKTTPLPLALTVILGGETHRERGVAGVRGEEAGAGASRKKLREARHV